MQTAVILFRYKGFLIRVVNNGSKSHPYEWTFEGVTPKTKNLLLSDFKKSQAYKKQTASISRHYSRYVYLGHFKCKRDRYVREYDPTSMPTSRGRCSALDYGKDAVDDFLKNKPRRRHWVYFKG